jgi:hypothetical protein
LLFCPGLPGPRSSYLWSPPSLGWQAHATIPSYWLRWGLVNFSSQADLEPWSSWSQSSE